MSRVNWWSLDCRFYLSNCKNHFYNCKTSPLHKLMFKNVDFVSAIVTNFPFLIVNFKMEETKCCPAAELMQYLIENYSSETRKLLRFHRKFTEEAEKTIRSVAKTIGRPVDDVTFVGIHNRRTVILSVWPDDGIKSCPIVPENCPQKWPHTLFI